jgi:lipopolysaccharide transport system ATP-binding protein
MSEKSPAIELRGVSKAYRVYRGLGRGWLASKMAPWLDDSRFADVTWALRDLELTVAAGEVVGLVGRNGSGKSTLLRIIAGITAPTAGLVRIHGELRCVLASGVAFDPRLTGRENVIYGSIVMGVPRAVARQRLDAIVAFAELREHIDKPSMYYSRGMRARLALAVALQDAPGILLLDEALSAGDAGFADRCRERLEELASSGRTVIVASHSMPFIRRLCTRALLLSDGHLEADGAPADVAAAYEASLGLRAADAPGRDVAEQHDRADADGAVELLDAELRGDDGLPRDRFVRGDRLELRLVLSSRRVVQRPRFRVELIAAGTKTRVTEVGSYYIDARTGHLTMLATDVLDGEHELLIAWPENPLGCGEFYWRVTVFSRTSADRAVVVHLRETPICPFSSDAFPERSWSRSTIIEPETEVTLTSLRRPVMDRGASSR